jgi:tetratricopeptide (TPR) repeat protein
MDTRPPRTLDERIAGLVPGVDESLRLELQGALRTLRDASNPDCVLLVLSRLSLRLLGDVLGCAGHQQPSKNLYDCIVTAARGDGKKVAGLRLLPDEMASYLHTVRTLSNKVDHDAVCVTLTEADAENGLSLFLRVLEWFYCEYERGPRLTTVYGDRAAPAVTLRDELERLRRELVAEGRRRREVGREAVVGLRFADVGESFKDRVDKLTLLRRLLGDRTVKLVCIVGRGGVGKTALLSKLCAEVERGELRLPEASGPAGADGIIYVSCRGTDRPTLERLFHDVGRVLGGAPAGELLDCWADPSRSLDDKVRFLLAKLRAGYYLLVLDNLEDALAPDNTLADPALRAFVELSLATPHALRLIATSREQVVVSGPAVRATRTVPLDSGLPEPDAVALLRDLDPEGNLGLRGAPEGLLREAARRCFGLPRALEAVAGILASDPMLTPGRLLEDDALFTGQVVEDLVAEHYRRVSDNQRRVLEALAVFGKPVPEAAVRFLLVPFFPEIDVPGCLRALARNYFVNYSRGRDTFELHPIDQQHAYSHIPDDGSYRKTACHRRAAAFYAELRKPEEEWKSLADAQPQFDEFDQRVRAGDYDGAYAVVNAVDDNYLALQGYSEWVVTLRGRLLGKLTNGSGERDNLLKLGYAYNRLCLAGDAIRCFETALALCGDRGEHGEAANKCKGNLARSLLLVGRIDEAVCLLEQVLEAARAYGRLLRGWGSRLAEAQWSGWLGEAMLRLGRPEQALEYHQLALYVSQVEGDQRWRVRHLANLGETYRQLDDLGAAVRSLQEGLQLAVQTGNRHGEGVCAADLAQIHHEAGQLGDARQYYERGMGVGLLPSNYPCAVKLGILGLEEGKAAEAGEHFARGLAMCDALLEKSPRLYDALYLRALAELGGGRPTAALASYRQALGICSARGVVQGAIRDVRLVQRALPTAARAREAVDLLEGAQN